MLAENYPILFEINIAIATIRRKDDLLRVIIEKLKPLFEFYDTSILLLDKDKAHFYDLSVLHPTIDNSETNLFLYRKEYYQTAKMPLEGSVLKDILRQLEQKNKPFVFDYEANHSQYTDAELLNDLKQQGYKEGLVAMLQSGGEVLGCFFLNSIRKDFFRPEQFSLFQAITDQLSVAVAHILANEEILEREREKALLLSLSEDMATIRDRDDLWRLMMEKIRPLIEFDDAVVAIYSKDKRWANHILTVSPKERQANDNYQKIVNHQVPIVDSPIEYLINREGNFLITTDEFTALFPDHPGIKLMQETDLNYTLHYKLIWGGDLIGQFHFHFSLREQILDSKLNLYKSIADQIAVAVANILANEEILEREREKALLLSLSEDMATIRDRNDLWQVMMEKIRPLFGFDDAIVTIGNQEKNEYYLLLSNTKPDRLQQPAYQTLVDKIPFSGSVLEWIMSHEEPFAVTTEALLQVLPDQPGVTLMQQVGIRHTLYGLLRHGGRKIGTINFHSEKEAFFRTAQFPVFQAIADQVSVAVANILANEEILEREQEKAILYNIAKCLATVKDKTDLLRFIFHEVQPLFHFNDLSLLVLREEKNCYQDWSALYPQISPSQINDYLHQHNLHTYPLDDALTCDVFERLEKAGRPIVVDLNEFSQRGFDYAALETELEHGIKEGLVAVLQVRGKVIGWLNLNSTSYNHFKEASIPLFQAIADQVAVAVANILANEEILEREREKTNLLRISEAISRINNRKELLQVVYQYIQPVFPFDSAGLFITDPEKDLMYEILGSEAFPDAVQQQLTEQHLLGPYQLSSSPPESWWMQSQVVIRSMTQEAQLVQGQAWEKQFEIGIAHGLKQFIGGPMYANGKKIGAICFNSTQEGFYTQRHVSMFKSISEQVSVTVANILANEEIHQREREKSVLLSISETLATIRDKQQLLKVVFEKLRPLFDFYDTGLFVLDSDRQNIEDWTVTLPEIDSSDSNVQLRKSGAGRIPFVDSIMEWVIKQFQEKDTPQIFYYNEDVFQQFPDYPQFSVIREVGYQESLAALLRTDKQEIGILFFNSLTKGQFQTAQFNLFQAVADQVAVAVANILANEEILTQKAEIEQKEGEKTLQLAITQALAKGENWEAKFAKVAQEINKAVPWHHIYFSINAATGHRGYGFVQQESGDYQFMSQASFIQASGLSWESFLTLQADSISYYLTPGYYTGEAFRSMCETHPLERVVQRLFQHRSALNMPVQCENGMLVGISMGAMEENAYNQTHLALLQKLMPSITLALEKLLAYEDIQQREKEKTLQISLNTILSQEGSWQEKFFKIAQLLEEIIPWNIVSFNLDFIDKGFTYLKKPGGIAFLTIEDFVKETGLSASKVHLLRAASLEHYNTSGIYLNDAYTQVCQQYPFKKLASQTYGIQSSLNVVMPIRDGDSLVITFGSRQPAQYRQEQLIFLERISTSISLAVQKLLAYKEIEQREQEKAMQIAVNNTLVHIKERQAMFQAIAVELNKVVAYDFLGTFIQTKNQATPLFIPLNKIGENTFANVNEKYHQFRMKQEQADFTYQVLPNVEYYAGNFFKRLVHKWPIARFMQQKFNIQEALVLPLPMRAGTTAIMCIGAKKEAAFSVYGHQIIKRLTPQIALALDNLFAFEEIESREQLKAMHLAVVNSLTSEKDQEQMLLQVATEINRVIACDIVNIHTLGKKSGVMTINVSALKKEGAFIPFYMQDLVQVKKILPSDLEVILEKTVELYGHPSVNVGEQYEQVAREYPLSQLYKEAFDLKSCIYVPITIKNKLIATMIVASKTPFAYVEKDLALLQELSSQMALAVENLLAFERIEILRQQLDQEKTYLNEEIKTTHNFEEIIGSSPKLLEVFKKVGQVAPTDFTTLILGETGTGKELIARAIHNISPRKGRALIKINCAAMPAQLIESELFGHERGSFTGATDKRIGKFELAHGSTIFLDEIGEMPLELQAKLLRVLQDKEIERIGGKGTIACDARIIAATNRNLEKEVAQGRFRSDLYYRLHVFPIILPALRERKEDIPLLAMHFLQKVVKKLGKNMSGITNASLQQMLAYDWPGNVRELEHVLERAAILSQNSILELSEPLIPIFTANLEQTSNTFEVKPLKDAERENILAALKLSNNRIRGKGGAAEILNIKPTSLEFRMKKLGVIKGESTVKQSAQV